MSSVTRVTVLAILLVLPAHLVGQSDDQVPRLPWGAPDLQGIWLYWTATPLQRPEEFGERAVVTAEEAADFVARRQDEGVTSGDWNPFAGGLLNGRTSLLIDPPNGRLPARTEAGQRQWDTLGLLNRDRVLKADGPEDRGPWERCIMGRSVPFFPMPFDQRMQILQTPDQLPSRTRKVSYASFRSPNTRVSPSRFGSGPGVRAGIGRATRLWSKRQTSTGNGRFTGPVRICDSSSGSPGLLRGRWTTSSPSTTRSRLPARGPGRFRSLRIRVPSMKWPVTRGTTACRSF